MDLVNVTDISIPQGSVDKITDSAGSVLWEKPKKITAVSFGGVPNALSTIGYFCVIHASVTYSDGSKVVGNLTNEKFNWSSSNPNVIAIESGAQSSAVGVRAKALGESILTVSIRNGAYSYSKKLVVVWTS